MIPLDDFNWLADKLLRAKFTFAKTMPEMPHSYTLRKNWVDADFVRAVELIRKYGYKRRFKNEDYLSFDILGESYWTMGAPINLNGHPHTLLINKAKTIVQSDNDDIAFSLTIK